jgi:very-short-patch-repair endonuclease
MRAAATPSEAHLWRALRAAQLGVVFRRQVVIGGFIAEVDGGCHLRRKEADARRDEALRRADYRVVRVSADSVQRELPAVLACIRAALASRG